ncbi:CRISPR-associated helicase/endonuclease Cas3 [Carboxydothermus pertinax]|uniref:CRISPR-associated helicase/endonuclease Cas3 n=1 Tax=Carboxydothermus pertinax TaxID=870242 RepID=A0A1L8CW00_9THEO|nr:CRISPR-associated helicase/endonuclease Cas3 [Carboxydothermus pertinax]GAV23061.1 CRISPR-associated helicase/endonuclease Cas3 [Carboxydothermus pertinax]
MVYYSHFDIDIKKLLKNHLQEVTESMVKKFQSLPGLDREAFLKSLKAAGLGHDFGKYTSYFQDHLVNKKAVGPLSHHAFLSAVWASAQFLNENFEGSYQYLALLIFLAVLRHHGNLDHPLNNLASKRALRENAVYNENLKNKLEVLKVQLEDLLLNPEIDRENQELWQKHGFKYLPLGEFTRNYQDYLGRLYTLYQDLTEEEEEVRFLFYFATLYLYSLLIDSDKKSAAGISEELGRKELSFALVEEYQKELSQRAEKSYVNTLRQNLFAKVISNVEKHFKGKIFSLTAPTGSGKTLAGLGAAFKLRELIAQEKGYTPRIIYALPFTSIIDQNFEVIKKILETKVTDFQENESLYLIKHHHLADLSFRVEKEEIEVEKALLFTESWDSEIIVTTFVQLFHTFFGFKNRLLKKFHKLSGSIILLDEVQNIPFEYWGAVREIFLQAAKLLDCKVILMTATKPLIFSPEECIELAGTEEEIAEMFGVLNRVKLSYLPERMTIAEFVRSFQEKFSKDKSYLIVVNTIKSSIELYRKIKELDLGIPLFYLSTNITPRERSQRLLAIKQLNQQNKPFILVSTQVVEAGVDLDASCVIRDAGPLDSVIQVAGRCNRSGQKNLGEVFLVNLITDEGQDFATRIYGPVLLKQTRELLEEAREIEEKAFGNLIGGYFLKITAEKLLSDSQGKKTLEAILNLSFADAPDGSPVISDFKLITEIPFYVDVFVELDEEAKFIWEEYKKGVIQENDDQKRRTNYLKLKTKLAQYIISVPGLEKNQSNIRGLEQVGSFFRLPLEYLEDYYSLETGFKRVTLGREEFEIL